MLQINYQGKLPQTGKIPLPSLFSIPSPHHDFGMAKWHWPSRALTLEMIQWRRPSTTGDRKRWYPLEDDLPKIADVHLCCVQWTMLAQTWPWSHDYMMEIMMAHIPKSHWIQSTCPWHSDTSPLEVWHAMLQRFYQWQIGVCTARCRRSKLKILVSFQKSDPEIHFRTFADWKTANWGIPDCWTHHCQHCWQQCCGNEASQCKPGTPRAEGKAQRGVHMNMAR